MWLLATPCLAWHVFAVVGTRLSRHCSALGKKFVYNRIFLEGKDSPKRWSVEVRPALDASRNFKSSGWPVTQLWLQCGTKGHIPTSGVGSSVSCSQLCAGLFCDLGQATAPLWAWVPSVSWRCWCGWLPRFLSHLESRQGLLETVLRRRSSAYLNSEKCWPYNDCVTLGRGGCPFFFHMTQN